MTDISELMRRDPLQMSDKDLDAIIAIMRASRHQFNLGNIKAGSTKPKTEAQKKISSLADQLNLKISL